MELKHIKGIGPAKQDKLKAAGVDSVDKLAKADHKALAAKTGMSEDTVKEYKEKAVALNLLDDIKGVGPATIKTLAESGIQSLKDLYEASSDQIAKNAKVAQEKVLTWQEEAKKMALQIAADAKTPEGRKKLASESKDFALKTVDKGQTFAKDVLAKLQIEGKVAIAKAQELKEKAPEYVHDARVKAEAALKNAEATVKDLKNKAPEALKSAQTKAEAALKDAEATIKDLKDKTEAALKSEVVKVKAANESFFSKLKARFSK